MKRILYLTALLIGFSISAQVTIEKNPSAPTNGSVSLELGNATGGQKGMVLPWVTNVTTSPITSSVVGTLVFDSATGKIKYATSSSPTVATNPSAVQTAWFDLSNGAAVPSPAITADANTELVNAKVIIGKTQDTTPGILVLSDTDKAMILPRVSTVNDIVNPSAGMIVFTTSNKQLAVFNGKEWSFWK